MYGIPWNLIAARLAGDLGGVTCYTDRYGRKTVYPIAPPEKPPSPEQTVLRSKFRTAQAAWKALTPAEKANLEEACRRASLRLTGQNLYISAATKKMNANVQALAAQTGIPLPTIPPV